MSQRTMQPQKNQAINTQNVSLLDTMEILMRYIPMHFRDQVEVQ